MANVDNVIGFQAYRHLAGGEIRTKEFTLTTGETVYKGDLLKVVAGGTVQAAAADDGIIVIGVASHYADDSASAGGVKVAVWCDPYITFRCQADTGTAPTAADVFNTANHVAGSGSSTTKISGHELDASDIGTGGQLKILGKIDKPGNDWGEHVELEVVIAEHFFNAAVAGV